MALVASSLLPVLVGYVIAAIAMTSLAVYTVRETEQTASLQTFVFLLVSVTVWTTANAGRMLSADLGTKLLFHYLGYVGIAFTPVAWLLFGLSYTGRDYDVGYGTVSALSLPAAAALVLAVVNPGGLYYSSVGTVVIDGTPLIDLDAGPLFWVFTGYAYLLLTVGLGLLVHFAATSDRLYRFQSVSLSTAAILPLGLNAAFLAGVTPIPNVDFTPITFALSALLIAVAMFYVDFAQTMPVAREAIIETLDDGILVTDGDDRIRYTNPAAQEILEGDDVVGTPLSATPLPDLGAADAQTHELSVDAGDDAAQFLFRCVSLDDDQTSQGTIYAFTDITERKELEDRLRQLQATTTELMLAESPGDIGDIVVAAARDILALPITGLWQYDEETDELQPVAMTTEGERLIGDQPTFTPGNSLAWQTFSDGDIRVFDDVTDHEDVYREDTPIQSEIQLPLGDEGLLISGATDYREFGDATLDLVRILANATELAFVQTDRELRLRRRERELQRENERLDEFTSVVAHDLRSPLNSADIFLDRLTDDYDDPRLERVEAAHDRTKQLVDDLLALARQGKAVETAETVGLEAVTWKAWESVATDDATLRVDDDETVLADESRLRQALENLFANSVTHAGSSAAIRVGTLSDADGFYVADDGPGIPAEERSQVFDHGYTQSEDGTGFGLAIVRRIAEAHDWSVAATEASGGGLRVEFHGVASPDTGD